MAPEVLVSQQFSPSDSASLTMVSATLYRVKAWI